MKWMWQAAVAVLVLSLAACGEDGDGGATSDLTSVGGAESPCTLPVTFEVPDGWEPEVVDAEDAEALGRSDLTEPGGFRWVCTIRSHDVLAPITVYVASERVGSGKTAPALLARFVAASEHQVDAVVRRARIAGAPGAAAEFVDVNLPTTELDRTAFLVTTEQGAVVVSHGGIEQTEIARVVPVLESIRDSAKPR